MIGWDRTGRGPPRKTWDGFDLHLVRSTGVMRALTQDLFRNPVWWRRAYRIARRMDVDVIHCHDLDTLPIGVRLKKAMGRPLVYDCHEVFGYMIEADMPRIVVDYTFRLERRLAPQADRVIAVNEMVKEYVDRITGGNAVVVRNCHEKVLDEYVQPPAQPFTILYLGTLHPSRFIMPAIEAMDELPEARLVIGGSKQLTDVVRRACAAHANTDFIGMVPAEEVFPRTIASHVVLSMFDPRQRINRVGLPNKIFEAMAAGRPVLVSAGLPMASLVEREGCGLAVPYSRAGFVNAVQRLQRDPDLTERLGRNGLAAAKREYNWAMESQKLVALYEDLERTAERPGGPS